MEPVPMVRLLSMAVTVALDELHGELARRGHPNLRPVHGYALNAVLNGHATASELAPILSMTKQGAAKVVQLLVDDGYVVYGQDGTDDARRKPLVLTPRGRAVIRLSERIQDQLENKWGRLAGEQPMATARTVLETAVTASSGGTSPPEARRGW
jgi:DNA-binding MarR family transcriptional regulator